MLNFTTLSSKQYMKKFISIILISIVLTFIVSYHLSIEASYTVNYSIEGIYSELETPEPISGTIERGASIQFDLTPLALDGHSFAFWIVNGVVKPELDSNSTFIATSKMNLEVVFAPEDYFVVLFIDVDGFYIDLQFIENGQSVNPGNLHNFSRKRPGIKINENNPWISVQGSISLLSITQNSVFMLNIDNTFNDTSNVSINYRNGYGQFNAKLFTTVSVVALQPSKGQVFNFWEENGIIVSYKENYKFTAGHNRTLEAIYNVDSIYPDNLVTLSDAIYLRAGYTTFIGRIEVLDTYELVECGFIFHRTNAEEITLDTVGVEISQSSLIYSNTNEFSTSFPLGLHKSIRSYLIVKQNDEIHYLYSERYLFETNIPNEPVLFTEMNPVYWDSSENEVIKFTSFSPMTVNPLWDESLWYDYIDTSEAGLSNQSKWANAKTKDGSYWVWIPRYVYNIKENWGSTNDGIIDIRFVNGTSDTNAIYGMDASNKFRNYGDINDSNKHWTSHPAFTFGKEEITGFWVAKFEARNWQLQVESKPGVTSWRNITQNQAFSYSRSMENNQLKYGWKKDEVDTHLTKELEWGAITYLSYSKYGTNTVAITPNLNASYSTGGGTQNAWKNNKNQSSTGNLYGIYDLVGGAAEFTASFHWVVQIGGACRDAGEPHCEHRISGTVDSLLKGHARYETPRWHGNAVNSSSSTYRIIGRGGSITHLQYGPIGLFYVHQLNIGGSDVNFGFRPIATPKIKNT